LGSQSDGGALVVRGGGGTACVVRRGGAAVVITGSGGWVVAGTAVGDGESDGSGESDNDGDGSGDDSTGELTSSGDGGAVGLGDEAGSTAASIVPPTQQGASRPTMPAVISNRTRCARDIRVQRSANLTDLPFDRR
jgi:hypothetical protein